MKTVAIIAEYNPFHNGHLYHINKIRDELGMDTAIIAIMSGNYVQRGEVAIIDKWDRAKMAVDAGINLVIELPFPFSMASAEYFANAGISIAKSLGIIDYISFGSESGCIQALQGAAKNILSDEFENEIKILKSYKKFASEGYAKVREEAYKRLFNDDIDISSPNNILAIEYLKALIKSETNIIPHTTKRIGAGYNQDVYDESGVQSATYIRALYRSGNNSAMDYIPENADLYTSSLISKNQCPCDIERLWPAISAKILMSSTSELSAFADCGNGLSDRLKSKASEAIGVHSLISLVSTKKYTTARIKRAMLFSFFGVTSSDLKESPAYTQVLAMDKIGQELLRRIKITSSIPAIIRPSSREKDLANFRKQKYNSDLADSVFQLTKPVCDSAASIYRKTPYVKK